MPVFWAAGAAGSAAEPLTAQAAVERADVFVGEPFTLQIRVSGSDKPDPPDLSDLQGVTVEERGGQQNTSHSVSIVNGRFSREVRRGYTFSYRITAQRAGMLVIPPLTVTAEGRQARTEAVRLTVREPAETEGFKLRQELSRPDVYVGEPVELTVTWYLGADVRRFEFSVPVLQSDAVHVADPPGAGTPDGEQYRVALPGGEAVAVKGRGRLDGKEYTTLQFRKVLIPKRAGRLELEPATVACETLIGYRDAASPFDSFFDRDFFGDGLFSRRRGVYRQAVVPSNAEALEVRDLPAKGRPGGFAGHVGPYRIEAQAEPTQVNVGDPIALKVVLSGPLHLDHVRLPPLNRQAALARDFRVPAEAPEGRTEGRARIFTQTVRALRADVERIPPLELPYFDTDSGEYRVARSQPIALTVHAARVVTAQDAEGLEPAGPAGSAVEPWTRGIAHNYEGPGLLVDRQWGPERWADSAAWRFALAAPPLAYLVLLAASGAVRRRRADPQARRARRAYAEFCRTLKRASTQDAGRAKGIAADALRTYLGGKLRRPAGALLYADVEAPLRKAGVSGDVLQRLGRLFAHCEAERYAGQSTMSSGELLQEARALAAVLEETLP